MSGEGFIPAARAVAAVDYPWEGQPRVFTAAAMPRGDRRAGIDGEMVLLIEDRGAGLPRHKLLARSEAAQLYDQLRRALGAFDRAAGMAQVDPDNPARPAHGPFPFGHRTLAEADAMPGEAAVCE